MSSLIGAHLGPYEITAPLGAGGMGEVYRARDSKLNRDVALKVLPELVATDSDRLARFKREAQVLASLNHPNIAAIYGFEESSDVHALVLELVEGPTLAERIAQGAVPIDEALPIARQMADALEAAHERGVVHRDLKPANIKLRPDGTVKVLDFGLAKALDPDSTSGTDVSISPTITSPALTRMGLILGTAAYMSPEQAKGRAADKRSDVWAFGSVLYEMLTGRRAFEGEDVAETLAFILTKEPDWSALPPTTPAAIRKLLRRCLEKDRRKRLADIADARLEIDESGSVNVSDVDMLTPGASTAIARTAPDTNASRTVTWALAGALFVCLAGGALLAWRLLQSGQPAAPLRFVVLPPEGSQFYFEPRFLSVSPDGRRLAFITGAIRSETRLWIRPLDSLDAQLVAGTESATNPLWSPDGRYLAFSTGISGLGRLRRIDLAGGPPLTLSEAGVAGAWNRQGVILFRGRDGRIYSVTDSGGDATAVTELDAAQQEGQHVPAFFLSDGRRFVFEARNRDGSKDTIYLASLGDSSRTRLLDAASSVAYADGYLLYDRDGTLMVQPFDDKSGRITGTPAPLIENIDSHPQFRTAAYSVSSNGVLVYRSESRSASSVLTWFSRDGKPTGSLPLAGRHQAWRRPDLSADGRHLALTWNEGQGPTDVWLVDLERSVPSRFTFDAAADTPLWSPDGRTIVFTSFRKGNGDLYQRSAGGAGKDEVLYESPHDKRAQAFSPDGKVLLFGQLPQGNPEIWALPMTGERKPVAIVSTGYPAGNAVFSPDGRWFAYCEGDSGSDQVYAQPYPPNGVRLRLSSTSGSSPQWSADGKTVVYSTGTQIMTVDVTPEGGTLRVGIPRELFPTRAGFFHRAFLLDSMRSRVLLPVMPAETIAPPINVIVNWAEEFQRTRQRQAP